MADLEYCAISTHAQYGMGGETGDTELCGGISDVPLSQRTVPLAEDGTVILWKL